MDLYKYENELYAKGIKYIGGVDEVGRGPLNGPVVTACVVLPKDFVLEGLTDSKKLSEKKRNEFYEYIKNHAIAYAIGECSPEEIDEFNIYEATKIAMKRAISRVQKQVPLQHVLIDAMPLELDIETTSIIKGDAKSISIAAASVMAKVTRDAMMYELDKKYPEYDKFPFEKCTFSFRRHIINYINSIPNIKNNLLFFSLEGKTGIELIRSFSWKIYLKTLSSDSNTTLRTWFEETVKLREDFKKLVKELRSVTKCKGDPLGGYQGGKWNDFFDNADIKHLIKIDVDRTFQERELFCENYIKDLENNILYLFSKYNEPTSYKQGMNDILAMLIYALYPYYRKSNINEYTSELFDKWIEKPIIYTDDIYNFFHDERYFQTDLYYLFINLMNLGVNKFYEDTDEKNNPGETKNYLVKRCEYISEKKLKLQNARLYHHFINIGIEPGFIMQRWIKCLFTREFHPQDSAVIWDAILANEIMEPSGNLAYVDYFSLAMLDFISDELLSKDQSD